MSSYFRKALKDETYHEALEEAEEAEEEAASQVQQAFDDDSMQSAEMVCYRSQSEAS